MKKCNVVLVVIFALCFGVFPSESLFSHRHRLRVGYYHRKCPQAEFIVSSIFAREFVKNPSIAANFLRIIFHDCFVTGCDASVLLDSTPSGEPVEKFSAANGNGLEGLNGLKVIDEIKSQLEMHCPGTVSCADIIAFGAREAVFRSGLPFHAVPAGRRDGPSSHASDVFRNLPFPTMSVDDMIKIYAAKGLSAEDMVVLSGAHSIGDVHCKMFDHRLYLNFSGASRVPQIDPLYAKFLKTRCPEPSLSSVEERDGAVVKFDPVTPLILNNEFYKDLMRNKGLLQSDQVLALDPRTAPIVQQMASNPILWGWKFVNAMVKLGKINVTTGHRSGGIRSNCRVPN